MPSVFETNAVYLQSGDPTKEATPVNNYPGQLGTRFSVQHPTGRQSPPAVPRTKRFQYVRVDPAAAAVPKINSPAYWVDRANYLVTGVGSTFLNQVAGVFGAVAPNKGDYCCIQQGGPCLVRASDANVTAAVAGTDLVLGGATDLGVLLAGGTAPTTQPLGNVASPKTTDVTGGTGNQRILVDLNLPDVL